MNIFEPTMTIFGPAERGKGYSLARALYDHPRPWLCKQIPDSSMWEIIDHLGGAIIMTLDRDMAELVCHLANVGFPE